MLIPSIRGTLSQPYSSLSRRVNANSQRERSFDFDGFKLIKKGEC